MLYAVNIISSDSGSSSSLLALFFTGFLKLIPCLSPSSKYGCYVAGDPIHNIIFNFFLPHIILIAYILAASVYASKGSHRGVTFLLGTGIYIFIIANGWYGPFASISVRWFGLLIIISMIGFFGGLIYSPARFRGQYQKGFTKGMVSKRKKEIAHMKRELQQLEKIRNNTHDKDEKEELSKQIANLKVRITNSTR